MELVLDIIFILALVQVITIGTLQIIYGLKICITNRVNYRFYRKMKDYYHQDQSEEEIKWDYKDLDQWKQEKDRIMHSKITQP